VPAVTSAWGPAGTSEATVAQAPAQQVAPLAAPQPPVVPILLPAQGSVGAPHAEVAAVSGFPTAFDTVSVQFPSPAAGSAVTSPQQALMPPTVSVATSASGPVVASEATLAQAPPQQVTVTVGAPQPVGPSMGQAPAVEPAPAAQFMPLTQESVGAPHLAAAAAAAAAVPGPTATAAAAGLAASTTAGAGGLRRWSAGAGAAGDGAIGNGASSQ